MQQYCTNLECCNFLPCAAHIVESSIVMFTAKWNYTSARKGKTAILIWGNGANELARWFEENNNVEFQRADPDGIYMHFNARVICTPQNAIKGRRT